MAAELLAVQQRLAVAEDTLQSLVINQQSTTRTVEEFGNQLNEEFAKVRTEARSDATAAAQAAYAEAVSEAATRAQTAAEHAWQDALLRTERVTKALEERVLQLESSRTSGGPGGGPSRSDGKILGFVPQKEMLPDCLTKIEQ